MTKHIKIIRHNELHVDIRSTLRTKIYYPNKIGLLQEKKGFQ